MYEEEIFVESLSGLLLSHDLPAIRQQMGVCPQYNVLFERLTVDEHLKFFCQLKVKSTGKR